MYVNIHNYDRAVKPPVRRPAIPSKFRENLLRPQCIRMIRTLGFAEVLHRCRQSRARGSVIALHVQHVAQDEIRLPCKGGVTVALAQVSRKLHGIVGVLPRRGRSAHLQFNFRAPPMPKWNGIIDSEVLVIEPNKKLSYSWGSLGLESVVVWTLVPTKGGTLVRMEQSGFRADQEANYQGANYGWQKFIGGLERVVGGLQ